LQHSNDTRAHFGYRRFNEGIQTRPPNPVSPIQISAPSIAHHPRSLPLPAERPACQVATDRAAISEAEESSR
jgi:hypothetical protein